MKEVMVGARGSCIMNEGYVSSILQGNKEYLGRDVEGSFWADSESSLPGRLCQTLGQKACSGRSTQCHLLHMSSWNCSQYWSAQHLGPNATVINTAHTVGPDAHVIDSCLVYSVVQLNKWSNVLHSIITQKQALSVEWSKCIVQFQL